MCNSLLGSHGQHTRSCALKMAIDARVLGRVLGRTKPVRYTGLCHIAKSHARL
ncbi:hypothetical protein F383_34772 [Gossypium arboreum]|uniref:Uncharacterized protein n=1 Tax=Gossypium arboreum TaxID=29729 RepID=A0A0B0N0P3_GOSAR|nr:hypothetical protein F383_34772 [Gossypium arboreum]